MRSVHILGLGLLVGMTALGAMLAVVAYRWQEATFPPRQITGAQTAQPPGATAGSAGSQVGQAAKPGATPAPGGAAGGNASADQAVFQQNCGGCHPGGNQGVGPALRGRNLQADLVSTTVRQGRGAMPPFSPGQISDQQLANLSAYVQSLR